MRQRTSAVILSAILALSWIGFFASAPMAQEQNRVAEKWDYKTVKQEELLESGREGWEAYAVIRGNDERPTYFLKRQAG
jgi:hypothetical protein